MKTKDITLRKLKPSDKNQLAILFNNKKIWDNLRDYIPHPYDEKDAEWFINFTLNEKNHYNFAIEYKNEFCGIVGLILQTDVYRKSAEIGYWLGEPFWGKGIMTKAVKLITQFGFEKLDIIRIYSGVFDFNTASMKVLEKCGYKKDAIFKKAIVKNDKICDEHRFYILKEKNHK